VVRKELPNHICINPNALALLLQNGDLIDWPVLHDTGVFWWPRILISAGCSPLCCPPFKNFCPQYCPETGRV